MSTITSFDSVAGAVMAEITIGATRARFQLGRTVQRSFEVIGKNAVTFIILSLLPAVPYAMIPAGRVLLPAITRGAANPRIIGIYALVGLAWLVGNYIAQAGITQAAVSSLNGKHAGLGECLSIGMSKFVPLLLLSIAAAVVIGLSFLLLIVPGIIVAVGLSVAAPVLVMEGKRVTEAMGRSFELTRGHRWAILGALVMFFLISAVSALLVGALGAALFIAAGIGVNSNFGAAALALARSMLPVILNSALVASIYYELRLIKEGVAPEALASVFD